MNRCLHYQKTQISIVSQKKSRKFPSSPNTGYELVLSQYQREHLSQCNGDIENSHVSIFLHCKGTASYCLSLQVDVAELRQKLQTMETLRKELEILQRQKSASEEAALNEKQRQGSGGVWGWLAGTPGQDN